MIDVTELKQAKSALLAKIWELDAWFMESQDLMVVCSADASFLRVNHAWERILGRPSQEFKGKGYQRFLHPEDIEPTVKVLAELPHSGRIQSSINRYRAANGEYRIIEWHGHAMGGQIFGTGRDITATKQLEVSLRQREQILELVAEAMASLMCCTELGQVIHDLLDRLGQITRSDRIYIFKNHEEHQSGRLLASQLYEWAAPGVAPQIDNPMLQNLPYDPFYSRWGKEMKLGRCISGLVRDFPENEKSMLEAQGIQSVLAVPVNVDGAFWGFLGFDAVQSPRAWDTAEEHTLRILATAIGSAINRQQMIDLLQVKDQAMDAAMDAMALTDLLGKLIYVNSSFLRLWGGEKSEYLSRRFAAMLDLDSETGENVMQAILEQGFAEGQATSRHTNGQVMQLSYNAALVRNVQGQPLNIVVSFRDITGQLAAQQELIQAKHQAQSAALAKSEFLANMSHEIRTPMTGVIGMTGLLLETQLTPEQRDFAQNIQASGEALLSLINDILDFSKIEAGRLELENLDFDLEHLIDDVSAMLALRAHEKNVELIYHLEDEMPVLLQGDPSRLRQILNNLVGNAVKFTEQGQVVIRVSEVEQDLAAERFKLRFVVQDTGIGIPEDKIDNIFDKFSQADTSTSRRFGGSGLGLAISRQLARMMGGEIGAVSTPGQGSEFWFTACFAKQNRQPVTTIPMAKGLKGLRVLVVDDNVTHLEILARRLVFWGGLPVVAAGASEALEALEQAHRVGDSFDLAIVDMQMPDMDGAQLGKAVKADTRFQDLPLVMLTSLGRPGDARRFGYLGFAAYLNKPVRHSELFDTLMTVSHGTHQPSASRPIITRHLAREEMRRAMEMPHFSGHVLVAEDNPVNQQVALGILKKIGLTVDVASDGIHALELIRSRGYDLVLMDVHMPNMDGLDATREIRKLEVEGRLPGRNGSADVGANGFGGVENHAPAAFRRLPIVAMTAAAMQRDQEKCYQAGMDDYLVKPVNLVELYKVLNKWLALVRSDPSADASENLSDPLQPDDPSMHAQLPVFDKTELLRRTMDDLDLARSVSELFALSLQDNLHDLRDMIAVQDVHGVGMKAHALKGAGLNVACPALAAAARDLEVAAKFMQKERFAELLQRIELEAGRVQRLFTHSQEVWE